MRLWTGRAHGAIGRSDQDIPTLTEFSPQSHQGNGTAVIVAPGGAYISLAGTLEGIARVRVLAADQHGARHVAEVAAAFCTQGLDARTAEYREQDAVAGDRPP